jgi:peptide/nickel transport system permease protein
MSTAVLTGSLGRRVFGRARRLPAAPTVASVALGVILVAALFGPLLVTEDPNLVNLVNPYAESSASHILGTDAVGRDIFSRLLVGARTAVLGPLIVVSVSTVIALTMAIVGAWFGGLPDIGLSRLTDLLLAFPGMLLAIVAASVFGAGLLVATLALSISYIPYVARIVRAEALRQRRLPYIEAAWLQGVPTWVIWTRYMIPSMWGVILAQTVLSFAYATIDVAAVSYLGLGVQAPTADWGLMVAEGQTGVTQGHPMEAFAAGACLVIMILSLGILGEHLAQRAERGR